MKQEFCRDCYEYMNEYIKAIQKEKDFSLEKSCYYIMSQTIEEPNKINGEHAFQVSLSYGEPWDADNTNIMRALYCILFPKVKQSKQCLRKAKVNFYEAKRIERVGETINSYRTMLSINRLLKENITIDIAFKIRFNEFKNIYHKPGNFLPFPGSLNYTKGYNNEGWNYLGDFFDIKLEIIRKEWKNIIKGESKVPLLNANKDFFIGFITFEDFCDYFYLEKFLNGEGIKFLCNHQGYCHRPRPFTKTECIKYMDNATNIINYRSDRMAKNLFEKLEEYNENKIN